MQHLRAHVAELAQLVIGYALDGVGIIDDAGVCHEYAGNVRPVFVHVRVQSRCRESARNVASAARENAYAAVGHAAVKAGDDDPAPRRKPLEIFVGALLVDRSVEGKMQPILCIEEIIAEVIGHEHRREIFAARDELILGYAGFYLPAQGGELRVDIDLEPQLGADLAIAPGDHVENWVAADAVLFVRMAEIQKVCQLVIVLEPLTRGGNDDHLSRRVCFDN